MKLLNAFSLNMLSCLPASIRIEEISLEQARTILQAGFESAVGHANTAAVFSEQLGITVMAERITISLSQSDRVIVGQYRGPRLEEGAVSLPEGATIQWILISVS